MAVFMYKVVNNIIVSLKMGNMFDTLNMVHGINTRANMTHDLVVRHTRMQVGSRAVSIFGCVVWNSLPLDIRNATTILTFKNRYWKFKCSSFSYSVDFI